MRAGTCIISVAKNRWSVSWGPFLAAEESFVAALPLCLAVLYSFSLSDCDGYLSRAENREPQQALGAEPEQTLQSETPGLSL